MYDVEACLRDMERAAGAGTLQVLMDVAVFDTQR